MIFQLKPFYDSMNSNQESKCRLLRTAEDLKKINKRRKYTELEKKTSLQLAG